MRQGSNDLVKGGRETTGRMEEMEKGESDTRKVGGRKRKHQNTPTLLHFPHQFPPLPRKAESAPLSPPHCHCTTIKGILLQKTLCPAKFAEVEAEAGEGVAFQQERVLMCLVQGRVGVVGPVTGLFLEESRHKIDCLIE